jgi:hypothetical protein
MEKRDLGNAEDKVLNTCHLLLSKAESVNSEMVTS